MFFMESPLSSYERSMSRAREKNWSEEHTFGAGPNGVGSDFGGDQRGQIELHAAAGLARKQQLSGNPRTELVRQVIPLCNRSGGRVQLKKFMESIHASGVTQVTFERADDHQHLSAR
jgi:hypothetical protein